MTLSPQPGDTMPGSGLSLKRVSLVTSAPSAAAVELDRLLTTAIKVQVGLDLHHVSFSAGLRYA